MVAMTATILPPQNRYLGACLASWWSEVYRGPYRTMANVENHMRAIDFALECGIDIIADTRVWSGEFDKVNALREGDDLHFGELALKLAGYVQKKHVRWVWSPAFGNSNPWWPAYDVIGRPAPKGPTASTVFGGDLNIGVGRAYRADKPEWQMKPLRFEASMCFAHEPAYQWLTKMTLQAMEAGRVRRVRLG